MIRVFLFGFMGAGKTTLGEAFASALGIGFLDLDQYIEAQQGKTIRQIFADSGEPEFRRIESEALREVCDMENIIIACGGSTPLIGNNMEYMKGMGQTVYLKVTNETLFRRLKEARAQRPLIASKNDQELMAYIESETIRREPGYLKAEYTFAADQLESIDEISGTIENLKQLLKIQ